MDGQKWLKLVDCPCRSHMHSGRWRGDVLISAKNGLNIIRADEHQLRRWDIFFIRAVNIIIYASGQSGSLFTFWQDTEYRQCAIFILIYFSFSFSISLTKIALNTDGPVVIVAVVVRQDIWDSGRDYTDVKQRTLFRKHFANVFWHFILHVTACETFILYGETNAKTFKKHSSRIECARFPEKKWLCAE